MMLERMRPKLTTDYVAGARAYAFDLFASALLFFAASIWAGRVWRFPFDDEIYTLEAVERFSAFKILSIYLGGGDVHPPLQYLFAAALHHIGSSEAGMRLVSVAMTASALALFHLLALTLIARRNRGAVTLPVRAVAVLLFGLSALAVSQGDAIRWYPLFAALIAMFVTLYLAGGNDAARLWSAVPLGLAASTNFLAVMALLPLAIYRYGLQRQFRASFDAAYWLLFALFASLGICAAYSVFVYRAGMTETQLGPSVVRAALTDALGFFGGGALGVSQAWIVIPVMVMAALATVAAVNRKQPADPAHLLLLIVMASALMVLPGFAKPRSFLYLAPVMAALLVLYFDRQIRQRGAAAAAAAAVVLVTLTLAASVTAIANINGGKRPFKRNSVIPYQNILDFIAANGTGNDLVISTDPVVPWLLRHRDGRDAGCVSYFLSVNGCFTPDRRYDAIFVIAGHSIRSRSTATIEKFDRAVDKAVTGRRKVATIHAGVDKDAELKSWLTGVPLTENILTIDLYR